jgi:hypothetical protein
MKRSPRPRDTVSLPDSFDQRLNSYALAAGAAAVAVLPLAQPADAKIIYTKTHQVIGDLKTHLEAVRGGQKK